MRMTSTRGHRRLAALVAAASLAVAAAGCGSADEPETVEVVQDLDLLEGAEAAGSARISWELDLSMPSDGDDLEMDGIVPGVEVRVRQAAEGLVDLGTRASEWSGTYAMEAVFPDEAVDQPLPGWTQHFEVRTTAEGEWFRGWQDGEEPPAWLAEISAPDDGPDADETPELSLDDPTEFDPTAFVDLLRDAATSFTVVGEEEIQGDATTRYRAVVDLDALDPDGNLGLGEDGSVEVDVWIDDDDRLRKVETEGLRLELWDFGTPVVVEAPTDVTTDDDAVFSGRRFAPEIVGDWSVAASGTSAAGDWEVWSAPATAGAEDASTTCRTLEVDGDGGLADAFGGLADAFGDEIPVPHHEGHLAACGNGTFGLSTGTFVPDPALQIVPRLGMGAPAVVAFAVRDDVAGDGTVRLVLDGAEPVELSLDDQGIATWAPGEGQVLVSVDLDGGAVTCPTSAGGEGIDAAVGLAGSGLGIGFAPCVRV